MEELMIVVMIIDIVLLIMTVTLKDKLPLAVILLIITGVLHAVMIMNFVIPMYTQGRSPKSITCNVCTAYAVFSLLVALKMSKKIKMYPITGYVTKIHTIIAFLTVILI